MVETRNRSLNYSNHPLTGVQSCVSVKKVPECGWYKSVCPSCLGSEETEVVFIPHGSDKMNQFKKKRKTDNFRDPTIERYRNCGSFSF